ncbi:MAG: sigma-54-dependent Fis family transcriptional regulator [Bacteroidales bacterium]|nr:sigma-54-dependent Fis family transcriptional regulator [Bacteroidales bacterium]
MEIKTPIHPILIVDDEKAILNSMEFTFRSNGYTNIVCLQNSELVMKFVENNPVEIILLDITMPVISGEKLLEQINTEFPEIPVVIITGLNDVKMAVSCMKLGAIDYLLKPVERNRLLSSIKKVVELRELKRQYSLLKRHMLSDSIENTKAFRHIITQNKAMKSIFKYMEAIGKSHEPVLINGETGTGKELFARAIYNLNDYKGKYVSVNVAGLDDTMFTDTLFGHVSGAYTGATSSRGGLVDQADNGVLFLDEIGDLSPSSQVKILRLIQEKEYYQLGADVLRKSNCRIVVATNTNLMKQMEDGSFRKDLFYRLSVHNIQIPPLRKRLDDITLLADHFLYEAAKSMNKNKPTPTKELYCLLGTYSFPGNVRELRSMIYDAVSQHKSKVMSLSAISEVINKNVKDIISNETNNEACLNYFHAYDNLPSIKEVEDQLIQEALHRSEGNQSIAAKILGISRQTLNKKIKTDNTDTK